MGYSFRADDAHALAGFIGAETTVRGDELLFKVCPRCKGGQHGDKDTFAVNLRTGLFCCLRSSCGYRGRFPELARDVGYRLDAPETARIWRRLPQREIVVRDTAIAFAASRGISEAVARRYKLTAQKRNPALIVFPFLDEQGVLRTVKYRDSKWSRERGGNKEWFEPKTEPILFGMWQCEDFGRLVVTEGQIDALSCAEAGIKNAVSVPNGANAFRWVASCWEWLARFENVTVFGDWEHGKMTLVDELSKRLPQKVKAVRREDYLGEKDANAILMAYGAEAVRRAVEGAELVKIRAVRDLSEVESVDINKLEKIRTGISPLDRVIGGLVMGQLILLTGKRGQGKSTFMSQMMANALEQGFSLFLYSGELANYHAKRWLDYQLAGTANLISARNEYGDLEYTIPEAVVSKINAWYKGRAFVYDSSYIPDANAELESLPDTVEQVIKQYGVKLVCIDNLMTAMDTVTDGSNLYLAQSNFVGRLKAIAAKYNVAVILVAHPRKTKENLTNDDISGSSDITNKADVVLAYNREDSGDFNSALCVHKNRLFGTLALSDAPIRLHYSAVTKRVFHDNAVIHYGWEYMPDAEEPAPVFDWQRDEEAYDRPFLD